MARVDGARRRAGGPRAGCGVRDGLVHSETDIILPLEYGSIVHSHAPAPFDAQVLPSGPSFDNENNLKLYATLIHKAERHSQRSYYEALLRAGVRVYLYRVPQVLHSKHFTIDEEAAVIGSSNMDVRSFSLNMEVSVLVYGHGFVDSIRVIEDGYRGKSRQVHLEGRIRRPVAERRSITWHA